MWLVGLDFLFFVVQLPKDLASKKDGIGTQECVAGLEDVVDVTGFKFKQCVPADLALPEEGYVRQKIVSVCELIQMLDAATLAPVQKIAQPLGVRLHGLGAFEEGFLAQELLYLIRHPLAIGIAILRDRLPHYQQPQA